MRIEHKDAERMEKMDMKMIMRTFSDIMTEQNKAFTKAMENFAKGNVDKKATMTQLTKAKLPPVWVGKNFERFRRGIEAWELGNKESPQDKYQPFVESLQKNTDVREYVVGHVMEKISEQAKQTVKNVLDLLAERFAKASTEKANEVFDNVVNFEMKDDESH
jgi:uncharacterized protein YdiU (UPF0061 family)